ncbi:MAG: acyltransferase family protein, partial [Candidatus Rokuibacteriota bacterium]
VQAAITAALLVGYWVVLTVVPVPGHGAGDLSKEGNLAAYVDRALLGAHVWRVDPRYDPEGVLSTLPALATVLLGVLAGHYLRHRPPSPGVSGALALAGIAGVGVGQLWSLWFPVNKALWTSSYVMLTGGLALLALAACHWLLEVRGHRRWAAPFVFLGVNALALYFLSSLAARLLVLIRIGADGTTLHAALFERLFAPWATPANASLAWAVAYVFSWWLAMWMLDRRGVRLRL